MNLTENEVLALKACLNYDDRESQLSDNMSNAGAAEFMELLGWDAQQVGGLMSSLIEKGLADVADDLIAYGEPGADLLWLTEAGVNAIFDIIEQEEGG